MLRTWTMFLAVASLPFVALACSGDLFDGWESYSLCPCENGVRKPKCRDLDVPDDPATCPLPDAGPDGSCGDDGGGGAGGGTCVTAVPSGWLGPVIIASGPALDVPNCPESTEEVFFGFDDPGPPAALACPECKCGPSKTDCALPKTWGTQSVVCQGSPYVSTTSFDPPANWDGSCTAANSIAEGKLCGGVPCVRSLVVDSPLVVANDCQVLSDAPKDEPMVLYGGQWSPFYGPAARACLGQGFGSCDSSAGPCANHIPSGFRACILAPGMTDCPAGYGERHVYYKEVRDERACAECGCSAPQGGACTVQIKVFTDNTCTNAQLSPYIPSDMGVACFDLMAGIALGSKSAEVIDTVDGTCSPIGGGEVGQLVVDKAATICCIS